MSDPLERLTVALADRYRIDRELGAGGMATVYLAEDLKHNRKVAVKVLKPELAVAIGAERFLAEIKTTANLQHPHILALHDSGEVNGTVFYVMPYVDGESLRDRLDREKQLPVDDALRIAGEVADALQYAHEHGVIHRDIKPENILLQRGHAVVADFGIALAASKTGGARMTETGMSLGTPTYMSPEQAMGAREVDARTDIYSLGCVLYEMLAGEPPFVGPTAQSIVAKVITESPKSLTGQRRTVPPHVDATVQKSLEKLAADRFASAAAFAESLRDGGSSLRSSGLRSAGSAHSSMGKAIRWSVATVVGAAVIGAAYMIGNRSSREASTDMLMAQRTYRVETIFSARYTAGGEAIVYSAAESGASPRIFTLTSDYPQPRAVSDSATRLLAVSAKDEMAVLVGAVFDHHRVFSGTLARMPAGGGTPRELLTDVHDADWSPDGTQLAVIHEVNGKDRLEYPIGTVLYETAGYLSDVRISPDGKLIAFNQHPEKDDDRGAVAVVDLEGKHRLLTPQFLSLEGLAWTRDGKRIAYSASVNGGIVNVDEVTLRGKVHRGSPGVGNATIQDIAADGRRLIIRGDTFKRILVKLAADTAPRDVSWLDVSFFPTLSGDGSLLAFSDGSDVAGEHYAVMLRRTDGSPAVRLGEGAVLAMSPDKQWVMSVLPTDPVRLMLYPTGAGTARRLDNNEFAGMRAAAFVGDNTGIIVCGNEPGRLGRCYTRPLAGGKFRPFTPEGVSGAVMSPDGQSIVARSAGAYRQFSVSDGASQAVPGLTAKDQVLRYSPDGRFLWTKRTNAQPVRVEQVDIGTGARSILLPDFSPRRAGVLNVGEVSLADDPRNYAYMERETGSYLFELRHRIVH
jgi:serine/threonine protein kinase/Tol biopolymer transport system component